jgi:hypothetical protein
MKEFFQSTFWQQRIRGETLFYQAAWRSLDLTIDRLDRDEFQQQLAYFRRFNELSKTHNHVPSERRTCIVWREGCSDACEDEVEGIVTNESIIK